MHETKQDARFWKLEFLSNFLWNVNGDCHQTSLDQDNYYTENNGRTCKIALVEFMVSFPGFIRGKALFFYFFWYHTYPMTWPRLGALLSWGHKEQSAWSLVRRGLLAKYLAGVSVTTECLSGGKWLLYTMALWPWPSSLDRTTTYIKTNIHLFWYWFENLFKRFTRTARSDTPTPEMFNLSKTIFIPLSFVTRAQFFLSLDSTVSCWKQTENKIRCLDVQFLPNTFKTRPRNDDQPQSWSNIDADVTV